MPTRQPLNIQQFIDDRPIGPFHWRVLVICLVVLVLDGFDVVAIGFIAPAIVSDWHVPREALGPVLSVGLFGLAIGALSGGPLADRFGRKFVIIGACILFGLTSLLSAWSPDLTWLAAFRFLTGLGLGASQPNAAILVSEYAPKRHRSLFVTVVYCGFTLGAAGGGFLSAWLIGIYGWRSILVVGGVVPIVFALALIVIMPESVRFLTLKRRRKDALVRIVNQMEPGTADALTEMAAPERVHASEGAIKQIVTRPYVFSTIALWAGLFVNLLTVYLLNSWLPIMVRDAGFTLADAALIGATAQVGGTLGNIVIGWLMDRWEPHKAQITILAGAAASALLIGATEHGMPMLVGLVFLLGFCINSANTGWTALAAGFYPTEIRATGTGMMTGIGRFGAISGASIGALVLGLQWSFGQIFMFLAVPISIGMVAAFAKARISVAGAASVSGASAERRLGARTAKLTRR